MSTPAERIRAALGMIYGRTSQAQALAALDELVAENRALRRKLDAAMEMCLEWNDEAHARCSRLEAALREIARREEADDFADIWAHRTELAAIAREALADEAQG